MAQYDKFYGKCKPDIEAGLIKLWLELMIESGVGADLTSSSPRGAKTSFRGSLGLVLAVCLILRAGLLQLFCTLQD